MKVAVMGGGIAGLAAAATLDRLGVPYVLFEKENKIGHLPTCGRVLLTVFSRPVTDMLAYVAQHGLELRPLNKIRRMWFFSPRVGAVVKGPRLGHINISGGDYVSFENQLARKVRGDMVLNSTYSWHKLRRQFDRVIVATGQPLQHTHLPVRTVVARGANVSGDFDPSSLYIFRNSMFTPRGYGFLIPLSPHEASACVVTVGRVTEREGRLRLKRLLAQLEQHLGQELEITETFTFVNQLTGYNPEPRVGNSLLTGKCFGSVSPFLGFDQFSSMLTGIYAAHDVAGLGRYEDLMRPLAKKHRQLLVLARAMENWHDRLYDAVVWNFASRHGQIFYNSSLDMLKPLSWALSPLVRV